MLKPRYIDLFLLLVLLVIATGVSRAQSFDNVNLLVDRGPGEGDVSLSWLGGQPMFRVYRAVTPTTLVHPDNLLVELSARDWTDHPPEGQLFFYRVTSDCVYAPPEVCDGIDNDCNGSIDEGCPPPENDTCASPAVLQEGVTQSGSTVTAVDDYDLSCLASDSSDTVHQFETTQQSSVLVTLTPSTGWELAAALRTDSECATDGAGDITCISSGHASRYINRPSLAADHYVVVVDGADGASGEYSIRYDAAAPDSTFGYWMIETSETYEPLADATDVTIPLSDWDVDPWPGDEWSVTLTLPFPFDYYGVTRSSINISSDLYLTFGTVPSGIESYHNDCPLDDTVPDDTIAVFWDDGLSNAAYPSRLLHATQGTAPNRRFVIEFRDWDLLSCGATNCYLLPVRLNHQVILHETGDIELRYGPRQPSGITTDCSGSASGGTQDHHIGVCATIGIEGQHGLSHDADHVQCNTADPPVSNGRVFYFVHPN